MPVPNDRRKLCLWELPLTTWLRDCRWGERGSIVLDDSLGIEITQSPSDADFILAHGTEAVGSTAGPAVHASGEQAGSCTSHGVGCTMQYSLSSTAISWCLKKNLVVSAKDVCAIEHMFAGEAAVPKSVSQLEGILAQCAALTPKPPMIVANPDFVTTSGEDLVIMPGHLGRKYADMGGKVHAESPCLRL